MHGIDTRGSHRLLTVVALAAVVALMFGSIAGAQDLGEYKVYFANLHAHTSYSDGVGTPKDAYAYARDVAGLDILAITDHGYYLVEGANPHHWEDTKREAVRVSDGEFLGLWGFEWTHAQGHINILATEKPASRDTHRSFSELVSWLETVGGIGIFNHPNYEYQPNWDDFSYTAVGDKHFYLIEVGSGQFPNNVVYEGPYARALDRGWRLGAVTSEDNHKWNWGTAGNGRTGVLARSLSREDVLEALMAMRTYASEDSNAIVLFTGNGKIMGSVLPLDEIEFKVEASDPDRTDSFAKIEIITNGGRVLAEREVTGRSVSWVFRAKPERPYNWYYARITQEDGDIIVTSPIWAESGLGIQVTDFTFDTPMAKVGNPGNVWFNLINRNLQPIPGAVLRFYVSSANGRELIHEMPLDIPGGKMTTQWFKWVPTAPGLTAIELEVALPGSEKRDVFRSAEFEVFPADVPKVMLDEGHNNRYSGYADGFIGLLRQNGYDVAINSGALDANVLDGVDVLIVANPEPGFAITPQEFTDAEVAAVAEFVQKGGVLILAGSSDQSDTERNVVQLNRLLEAAGSSIRFADDEVQDRTRRNPALDPSDPSKIGVVDLAKEGFGEGGIEVIFMQQACSLMTADGGPLADGDGVKILAFAGKSAVNKDTNGSGAWHEYPSGEKVIPVIAAEKLGKGTIVALGAPIYSAYEFSREEFDNKAAVLALIAWALGR